MSRVCAEELKVGISAYASPHVDGFSAISKARFSDFIVNEVDLNGQLAQLTVLEKIVSEEDKPDTASNTNDLKKSIQDSTTVIPSTSDLVSNKVEDGIQDTLTSIDNEQSNETFQESPTPEVVLNTVEGKLGLAQTQLADLVGDTEAQAAITMIRFWETTSIGCEEDALKDQPKNHTFPHRDNKDKRRQIHELVRSDIFSEWAIADTFDQRVRIWHKKFEKESAQFGSMIRNPQGERNRNNHVKKQPWPKDLPNYLKFVLYKENIDTHTAVKDMARMLHLPFKSEGPRDYHQPPIGYAGMKDKRGITSQFCTIYRRTIQDLEEIINRVHSNTPNMGGGNTQGGNISVIRVGSYSYTKEGPLDLGQLSGNRFTVVLRNVELDDMSHHEVFPLQEKVSLLQYRLAQSLKGLQDIGFVNYFGMQRFGKEYDTHEVGLAVLKGNFEKACDIIMRVKQFDERSNDVRKKWESRFTAVNMEDERAVRDAEAKCAKLLLRQIGRFMNAEYTIVDGLSKRPCDYRFAFLGIAKHLRSMYTHGYQSYIWNKAASYRIEQSGSAQVVEGDLVLLNGDCNVDEPSTKSWDEKKVKIVTTEDVANKLYSIHDVVLPLVGSKVKYPTDSTGAYIETLLQEDGLDKAFFVSNQDRDTVLRGDYRKLLCKPTDVTHKLVLYREALQPLLQTDLMRLNGVDIENVISLEGPDDVLNIDDTESSAFLGSIVSFTLPQSAYATITLREFMKRPTAGEYQASLPMKGKDDNPLVEEKAQSKKPKGTTIRIGSSLS